VLRTILADLRSHVSSNYTGLFYWSAVFGKALLNPAIHVTILYRIGSTLYRVPVLRPVSFLLRSVSVVWGGTEIHPSAQIGPGLCLVHSMKIVIGPGVRIGANARISHGVSIGSVTGPTAGERGLPVIGDNVVVALDAVIMGPVNVGDGAVVSVGSLVVRDVPARAVVAGSPARTVRRLDDPAS
jgi:serine O-acetyltransferase